MGDGMDKEVIRNILVEFMNKNLLNSFVNCVFNYNLKDNEYVYIQFKTTDMNIVMNIFDNAQSNRFNAFIFTNDDTYDYAIYKDDIGITYLNNNNCYKEYKKGNFDKLILFSSLMKAVNKSEQKDIIDKMVPDEIKTIFESFI